MGSYYIAQGASLVFCDDLEGRVGVGWEEAQEKGDIYTHMHMCMCVYIHLIGLPW